MALAAGTRLGPYEVVSSLGAGGMGEVYRARDTRLHRDVAIKVLPAEVATDADRLARFSREAQVLASLNHPHIAHVYGVEESGTTRGLVMELVDGDTLAEQIARGPFAIGDAIQIARQIADALDAAHERGIVHRDLKPANIKLTPDGRVKVLDFGLAKALDRTGGSGESGRSGRDAQNSPTITTPAMTHAGIILGTASYMSPEQARGKTLDKRADIWAFGVVLYEMLTGKQLFAGDTVSDTIAEVLKRDVDLADLPPATPPRVQRLLARCLQRDPKLRLRDIGDAVTELDTTEAPEPVAPATVRPRGLSYPAAGLLVLMTALVAAGIAWGLRRPPDVVPRPVARFELIARDLRVDPYGHPILSPDGRRVAWAAGGSLWLRELNRTDARVLARDVDPLHLAWSPDSQEIMFFAANRLWRVRITGGEPVVIAEATFRRGASSPGGAWFDDGRIVFASSSNGTGLLVVDARGGAMRPFLDVQPGVSDFHSPSPLPGGRGVVVVLDRERDGIDTIAVVSEGKLHTVIQDAGERFESPVYSAAGFILFERQVTGQGIWAIPYSLERLQPTGEPFLVAANASWPSVSADGTLVHTYSDSGSLFEMAIADRAGKVIKALTQPAISLSWPRMSHDGQRVVATLRDQSGTRDLYSFDVASGRQTRLTFGSNPSTPRWVQGDRVLFQTGAPGTNARNFVALISGDGGGKPQELAESAFDPDISVDGRWLVFVRPRTGTGSDILARPLEPTSLTPVQAQPERPIVASSANERQPLLHPSGAFLAYVAEDSGRPELYVTRFPDGQGKWQVSSGGVYYTMWTPSGDRLLYSQGDRVIEVPIKVGATVTIGTPRVVLEAATTRAVLDHAFDITKDDQLVFIRRPPSEGESVGTITVVQNWLEEFRGAGRQ